MIRTLIPLALLLAPAIAGASDGVLFMTPARGSYVIGDTFEVQIRANTDTETIIAAEADLSFPPGSLMVQSISIDGSILSQWPTPPVFSNTEGTIRFSGTGARYTGDSGLLATVTFTAVSQIPGNVRFESGAMLANDARATNIITSMQSALYSISPQRTVSTPEPSVQNEIENPIPEVAGASIETPVISTFESVVSEGSKIVLSGTASPDAYVIVYLRFEDDVPSESTVRATKDGTFTYVSPNGAQRGSYRAWAEVQSGTERLRSEEVLVRAESANFAAGILAAAPIMGVALPYVLALVALGCTIGFLYNRRSQARHGDPPMT